MESVGAFESSLDIFQSLAVNLVKQSTTRQQIALLDCQQVLLKGMGKWERQSDTSVVEHSPVSVGPVITRVQAMIHMNAT